MTTTRTFHRVVIGLHQSTLDRTTMRIAAEYAELLRVDLLGMFIEDPGIRGIAQRPGAREFRLIGRHWKALEPDALSREMDLTARAAERLLNEAARARGVHCRCQTVRVAASEMIAELSAADDIIIIPEPSNPAARAMAPLPQLLAAAFASSAKVLFVPRRVARARGPVVAIAVTPDDPSIDAGETLARAAHEHLVVVEAFEGADADTGSGPTVRTSAGGLAHGRLYVARRSLADLRSIAIALAGLNERMIVIGRDAFGDADGDKPGELASLCAVPVLLVESAAGLSQDTGSNNRAA
jgi:hypothetical protein